MQKITQKLAAVLQMLSKYSQVRVYVNINKLIKQLENEPQPESVAKNLLNKFKNVINK